MTPPTIYETIAFVRDAHVNFFRDSELIPHACALFIFEERYPTERVAPEIGIRLMCLAIPAQISELLDDRNELAMVDIMGVRRRINIDLLSDDPPKLGDWVLIHVGFAMSKIGAQQAEGQLRLLAMLGEASAAEEEVAGYQFATDESIARGETAHEEPANPNIDGIADENVGQATAESVLPTP